MRSRDEIETDPKTIGMELGDRLILEVLLDIRDLLLTEDHDALDV